MVDLCDLLGHILVEITRARVCADLEAVRTAKMYAADNDGLLKCFVVPHVRAHTVDMTMPLIITDVPDGYMEKTNPELFCQSIARDVYEILSRKKIRISTNEITKIIKGDKFLSQGYLRQDWIDTLSISIWNHVKRVNRTTKDSADVYNRVITLIREQLVKTIGNLPLTPLGIGINAKTSAIKEYSQATGLGANVVYLTMKIVEDALEIVFKDPSEPIPEGQSRIKQLTPE